MGKLTSGASDALVCQVRVAFIVNGEASSSEISEPDCASSAISIYSISRITSLVTGFK
jgi:hypothetical protein